MQTLKLASAAVQAVRNLENYQKVLLNNQSKIRSLQKNQKSLDELLSEEIGMKFLSGTLQRLKPLVISFQQTGKVEELGSRRNLRALCYLLDSRELSDPPMIESKSIFSILELLEAHWSDSFLPPLIVLILRRYGKVSTLPEAELLVRGLIQKHIADYKGNLSIPLAAQKFPELAKGTSTTSFSEKITLLGNEWFQACAAAGIPRKILATTFCSISFIESARKTDSLITYLDDTFLENLEKTSGTDTVKVLIAIMIERLSQKEHLERKLISLAFRYIGDPINAMKWKCVQMPFSRYNDQLYKAQSLISGWINRQVLEYFFEKADIDLERKRFWSQYAQKMHQIRIAMHWYSFSAPSIFGNSELDRWLSSRLIKVRGETTDIGLIMEIGDWVIVEIGRLGNACYIYDKNNPLVKNLHRGITYFSNLKNTYLPTFNYPPYAGEGRFIHYEGWEYRLRNILKNKMGI